MKLCAAFFAGKHPVSVLSEFCIKSKWQPPQFQVVHDSGPDHKKSYLMKVGVGLLSVSSFIMFLPFSP
jgi:dsRNA-specific ribonuclease